MLEESSEVINNRLALEGTLDDIKVPHTVNSCRVTEPAFHICHPVNDSARSGMLRAMDHGQVALPIA